MHVKLKTGYGIIYEEIYVNLNQYFLAFDVFASNKRIGFPGCHDDGTFDAFCSYHLFTSKIRSNSPVRSFLLF